MTSGERAATATTLRRALVALRELSSRLEAAEAANTEPIAIIGAGCRLPGGIDGPDALWKRLREGFELARFNERTGLPPSAIEMALREAESRGLVERDWERVRPTVRGFDFLSDLQSLFLPSP